MLSAPATILGRVLSTAAAAQLPASKLERLRFLLEHWPDIFHAPVGSSTAFGCGVSAARGPALLPEMHRGPAVRELVRSLAVVRLADGDTYPHLVAFHRAEWRIESYRLARRRPNGKRETVVLRRRASVVPGWVDGHRVEVGEEMLRLVYRGDAQVPAVLSEGGA